MWVNVPLTRMGRSPVLVADVFVDVLRMRSILFDFPNGSGEGVSQLLQLIHGMVDQLVGVGYCRRFRSSSRLYAD